MDGLLLCADAWRGWRRMQFPAASWRWEGGVLSAVAGAPRVDLVSRGTWADFELAFEFALPAGGNSGLLYRADEATAQAWQSGPELQLLDDARHPDGREPATRNGALYGLRAPDTETPIAPERFMHGCLRVHGTAVEHWLDGRQVLAYRLDEPALQARIAASKFAAFPGFARAARGHLVLQHHGDAVRWRNLRLTLPGRARQIDERGTGWTH